MITYLLTYLLSAKVREELASRRAVHAKSLHRNGFKYLSAVNDIVIIIIIIIIIINDKFNLPLAKTATG